MEENEVEGVYEPEPKMTFCEPVVENFLPQGLIDGKLGCPTSLEKGRSTNEATWL